MKIIEIKESECTFEPDSTNLIHVKSGKFIFPMVDHLCMIKIIFIHDGEYELSCIGVKFQIGNTLHRKVVFHCGCAMFAVDTQSSFIYSTESQVWHIITQGNVECTEEV